MPGAVGSENFVLMMSARSWRSILLSSSSDTIVGSVKSIWRVCEARLKEEGEVARSGTS